MGLKFRGDLWQSIIKMCQVKYKFLYMNKYRLFWIIIDHKRWQWINIKHCTGKRQSLKIKPSECFGTKI